MLKKSNRITRGCLQTCTNYYCTHWYSAFKWSDQYTNQQYYRLS